MQFRIANLFATPMAEMRMPEPESLCSRLSDLFIEKESEGDEYRNETRRSTQHGPLFESKFDLFSWPNDDVQKVAGFCHAGVVALLKQISDLTDEQLKTLTFDYHAWFHVTRKGGYQGLHNHQNASWSGIFCIDPGDTLPDNPQSGVVRFHDPRTFADMYRDSGNSQIQMPFKQGAYEVSHEPGKLVIFPSHLNHEIFMYEGEQPRIIVAFNCQVRSG